MKKKLFRLIVLCGCLVLWAAFFFFQTCVAMAPFGGDEWYLYAEAAGFWLLQIGTVLLASHSLKIRKPFILCYVFYLLDAITQWGIALGVWSGRLLDAWGVNLMCGVLDVIGAVIAYRVANKANTDLT